MRRRDSSAASQAPRRSLPDPTFAGGANRSTLDQKTRQPRRPARPGRPDFEQIILVLQGGGALGAYQAGVYEALAERGIHPDWVTGISIGAINAALIAGNPPEA